MKDGKPENKYMQLNCMIASVCAERGLPLPMATEFNMTKGGMRMYMPYDPKIARYVTQTAQVVLREIMYALEQQDIELAKKMVQKEIEVMK